MCQERGETGSKRDAQSSLSAEGGGEKSLWGQGDADGDAAGGRGVWSGACVSIPYGHVTKGRHPGG